MQRFSQESVPPLSILRMLIARIGLLQSSSRTRTVRRQHDQTSRIQKSQGRPGSPGPNQNASPSPITRPWPSRTIGRSPAGMSQLSGLRLRRAASMRNLSDRSLRQKHGRNHNSTRSLHLTSGKRRSIKTKNRNRTRSHSSRMALALETAEK